MKNNQELLSGLLKTAQLSQTHIRSVLDLGIQPTLRSILEKQLQEYDTIAAEAHFIASQRGWELQDTDPILLFLTDLRIRLRLTQRNCDSRIADIMIRFNTQGIIQGLKNLHRCAQQDGPVCILIQQLLDCQTAGIRQLQPHL